MEEEQNKEEIAKVVEELKQEEAKVAQNRIVEDAHETASYENQGMKKVTVLGMISFIFSLIGIFFAGLPCGIVALITGIIGIAKFNPEKETNRWMAITGLALGAVEIVVMVLWLTNS